MRAAGAKSRDSAMKIIFDSRQSVEENDSYSPSAQKPAQVVESWKRRGIPLEFPAFEACTREQIKRVHDPHYVDGVLTTDEMRSRDFIL
jgi:acetoin utilization deacetylase AcuC-like enzyme